MNKTFKTIMALAMSLILFAGFTACSNDNDDDLAYFTLGIENLHIFGSDMQEVMSYSAAVEQAYYKALGMTDGQNYVMIKGDYDKIKKDMKSRFDNAELPAVPQLDTEYTFTYVLKGQKGVAQGTEQETVASKVFTNEE